MQNLGAVVRDGIPKDHPYRDQHPQIPWKDIAGLPNAMAYDYGIVDHEILLNAAINDLPDLVELAGKETA